MGENKALDFQYEIVDLKKTLIRMSLIFLWMRYDVVSFDFCGMGI